MDKYEEFLKDEIAKREGNESDHAIAVTQAFTAALLKYQLIKAEKQLEVLGK